MGYVQGYICPTPCEYRNRRYDFITSHKLATTNGATWPTVALPQHVDRLLLHLNCYSPGLVAYEGQVQHVAQQTEGGSAGITHNHTAMRVMRSCNLCYECSLIAPHCAPDGNVAVANDDRRIRVQGLLPFCDREPPGQPGFNHLHGDDAWVIVQVHLIAEG